MITFSSHHMPTSQSYPNIKCIILTIDKDSHINIACKIAKTNNTEPSQCKLSV